MSDHQLLISIIRKNLSEMSPRKQRLMMKLQRDNFKLIYTPHCDGWCSVQGTDTDTDTTEVSSAETEVQLHVDLTAKQLLVSDKNSKQITAETEKDPVLQKVTGDCQQYYDIRAEMSVMNGLLLRRYIIVIPHSLRKEMLKRLHEGHLGMEKWREPEQQYISLESTLTLTGWSQAVKHI